MSQITTKEKAYNVGALAVIIAATFVAFGGANALFATILGAWSIAASLAVAAVIWKLLPYFALVLGNIVFGLERAEARRSPIETLKQMAEELRAQITASEKDEELHLGDIEAFNTNLEEYRAKFSDDPAGIASWEDTMQGMVLLGQEMRREIEDGYATLEEFKREMERATIQERLTGNAARAANRRASRNDNSIRNDMLTDEALNAVREKMARTKASIAALSNRMQQGRVINGEATVISAPAQIAHQPAVTMQQGVTKQRHTV